MPGRVHPLVVNHACRRTNGNILLNQLEVCAGLSCTAGQVCFAVIPVRDRPLGRHAPAVIQCGRGQRRIPSQPSRPSLCARLVGQRKQLFGRRRNRYRIAVLRNRSLGQKEQRRNQRQRQN